MTQIRIATFNLENFDETLPTDHPSLADRIELMRPQITRLRADIVCFQEVHGQERPAQPRELIALKELLVGTNLDGAPLVSTKAADEAVFRLRNLVIATHLPVIKHQQLKNDLVAEPRYQRLTAQPPDAAPVPIIIERPILHAQIDIDHAAPGRLLHVITVHLKSKIPSDIPGQVADPDKGIWHTADGWAEGSFLSSMKRMSQALEVRRLVDQILNDDPDARIIVAGDFNAEPEEVPVLAICGNVEDTNNGELATRVLVPIERTIPGEARYTLFHHGRGQMIDHMLVTRNLLAHYRGSEIHNEILHDDSIAFATDTKYPESDHAPVVATFDFD
ncbi:endonuclease/exonuclease/phosphatase family protein [Streptomyces sp. ISL-43]|uniref:endonuclease/exonuclease/phosphatase family protein n=1 Tax=Streptomyces sp. ISL-43 TaxID=2819183 RepID=UPI001BE78D19|nr:endonuclease/exonuclease/phosphatase family protein [Streptomyces sp. ISL-43]MBT2449251.1 endonuclease/exonuclease/phosphatase family protein [Streptomyces sp. ISL-43]